MDSVNMHCFEEPSACLFLNHGQNSTCLEMVVYISELMEERENPMELRADAPPPLPLSLEEKAFGMTSHFPLLTGTLPLC